jgi:hypothetical protein
MVVMGMMGMAFAGTFRADSLGHVVYALHPETFGVIHLGYRLLFKTECTVAYLTVKMHVAVIVNIAMGMTELVSYTLTAVINLMQKMALLEKHQSTEYARLVDGVNTVLQLRHGDRVVKSGQRL